MDVIRHLSSNNEVGHGAVQIRQPCGYSVGIISRESGGSGRYAISSRHILSENLVRYNIARPRTPRTCETVTLQI